MVSVALCSYNGAKYIKEQIESIINQTCTIDEIVICDDGSTDATISIINDIKAVSEIVIKVYRNEIGLGVNMNFQKAISLCRGEYVFLSDQDDIWMPDKVECVIKWFESHPHKSVVFTDGELVDSNGNHLNHRLFECVGISNNKIWRIDSFKPLVLGIDNRATGATMAIKRDALSWLLPIIDDKAMYHDYQLAYKAAERMQLGTINKPLIKYRCHRGQATTISCLIDNPMTTDFVKKCRYRSCLKSITINMLICDTVNFRAENHSVISCMKHIKQYIRVYKSLSLYCMLRDMCKVFYLNYFSKN